MRYWLLRILLLLGVKGGMIASSNPPDSADICLTPIEFDFYADKYVRWQHLKADTGNLGRQNRIQETIIGQQQEQLKIKENIILNQDTMADIRVAAYNRLQVKYQKSEKKAQKLKKATGVVSIVALILFGLVLIR